MPQDGTGAGDGLYSAPPQVASVQYATVQATSQANSTWSQTASITILPNEIRVTIDPASVNMESGQSADFHASVSGASNTAVDFYLTPASGTLGNLTSNSVTYNAPFGVTTPQTVTLRAVSRADSTKSASANITINPARVPMVGPVNPSSGSGLSQLFRFDMHAQSGEIYWARIVINAKPGGNNSEIQLNLTLVQDSN